MEANVYSLDGKVVGKVKLPEVFKTPVRKDLIKKAFLAVYRAMIQPWGAKPKAGRESSAKFRGIRRGYGHSYGWGIARIPRLMIRGGRRIGRAVNVPQAVGGPRAHPPKAEKVWAIKINKKERRLAILSALAASTDRKLVTSRGHRVPEAITLPVIVVDDLEEIEKTSELRKILEAIGLREELERASRKKIRAGKGKMRGRKYKKAKGPLIIVSEDKLPVFKAARNLPGIDIISARNLNVFALAPGAHPGRLCIFSKKALEKIKELFSA